MGCQREKVLQSRKELWFAPFSSLSQMCTQGCKSFLIKWGTNNPSGTTPQALFFIPILACASHEELRGPLSFCFSERPDTPERQLSVVQSWHLPVSAKFLGSQKIFYNPPSRLTSPFLHYPLINTNGHMMQRNTHWDSEEMLALRKQAFDNTWRWKPQDPILLLKYCLH